MARLNFNVATTAVIMLCAHGFQSAHTAQAVRFGMNRNSGAGRWERFLAALRLCTPCSNSDIDNGTRGAPEEEKGQQPPQQGAVGYSPCCTDSGLEHTTPDSELRKLDSDNVQAQLEIQRLVEELRGAMEKVEMQKLEYPRYQKEIEDLENKHQQEIKKMENAMREETRKLNQAFDYRKVGMKHQKSIQNLNQKPKNQVGESVWRQEMKSQLKEKDAQIVKLQEIQKVRQIQKSQLSSLIDDGVHGNSQEMGALEAEIRVLRQKNKHLEAENELMTDDEPYVRRIHNENAELQENAIITKNLIYDRYKQKVQQLLDVKRAKIEQAEANLTELGDRIIEMRRAIPNNFKGDSKTTDQQVPVHLEMYERESTNLSGLRDDEKELAHELATLENEILDNVTSSTKCHFVSQHDHQQELLAHKNVILNCKGYLEAQVKEKKDKLQELDRNINFFQNNQDFMDKYNAYIAAGEEIADTDSVDWIQCNLYGEKKGQRDELAKELEEMETHMANLNNNIGD